MKYTKEKIERRIKRIESKIKKLKESHGENPGNTHTYHGGWKLGYWEGKLYELEEMLGDMFSEEEKICMACNGSGTYDHVGSPPCMICNGTGKEVEL